MLNSIFYILAFAAALTVVAIGLEHLAVIRRQPRRLAWALAISCSALLPPMMMLKASPEDLATPVAAEIAPTRTAAAIDVATTSTPPEEESTSSATVAPQSPASGIARTWQVTPPSRSSLLAAWGIASGALLAFLAGSGLLLRRRTAGWRRAVVHGHCVLVSEDTGPALLGALRLRIVVPRWFLDETAATQLLILEHERQHIAARDPLLLRVAMLIAIAAPWNLPLWWQLHRLRLAIELDCDTRVMRGGADAARYGEVLLGVTQRAATMPVGVVAMSEPESGLEKRIRNLAAVPGRYAVLRMIGALLIAAAGIGAAAALEAPAVREPRATQAATAPDETPPAAATRAPTTPDETSPAAVVRPTAPQPATTPAIAAQDEPKSGDQAMSESARSIAIRQAFAMDAVIDDRHNADGTPLDPLTFGKPICRVTRDGGPALDAELAALAKGCKPLNVFGTDRFQTDTGERSGTATGPALIDRARADHGAVDLNTIPSNLLQRMEVVTGGASATYGSGAMRDVVNLVLNNRLTGFKLDMDYGLTDSEATRWASVRDCAAARAWCRDREARASSAAPVASNWVDLRKLIGANGERFNRRFIVDPRVGDSVDIGGLDPTSISYHALLEVLGAYGFVAVRSGDVATIIPGEFARTVASPVVRAAIDMGDDAEVVTALIPIQGLSNPQLLARSLSPWAQLSETPDGKSLLVMDKVANVKRLADMVLGPPKAE